MKQYFVWPVMIASTAFGLVANGGVVINEIMYHPVSFPENPAWEWIELHNPDAVAVNLNGWRITRGVDFTFTQVTLPAGGYLVVAADRAALVARDPSVTNVVGNWTGKLGNNGQTLQLEDAAGQVMDRITYATEGDWAIRRAGLTQLGTRGWEWYSGADGDGNSLELRNALMPHDVGQNWGASLVNQGTPGRPNSLGTTNAAPLILDVRHFPAVPRSTEAIRITARLLDEQATGLAAALHYRPANTDPAPAFTSTPMYDDGEHSDGSAGDGIFGVVLPARPHLTIIEFYVEAVDSATNSRTWPAPTWPAADQVGPATQAANALFQVSDEAYAGDQPVYRILMTETERSIYQNINRSSDAQMNATFITIDGSNEEVRYSAGMRVRGAGSRGRTPPNNRVQIPNDRPWKGLSALNLNGQYTQAQLSGGTFAALAGLPAAPVRAIQYRINGVNPANSGSPQYGSFVALEPIGGEWAGRQYPQDGGGNVYRGSRAPWTANLSYRGTNAVTYQNEGYSKNSNRSENDWTDLIQLTYALSANVPDAAYVQTVRTNFNVEEALLYFAVCNILEYSETSLCIGVGDDFALYRGMIDPRFQIVSHDYDTILGEGDTSVGPNSQNFNAEESIWVMIDRPPTTDPAQRTVFLERFMRHPEFAPIYYRQLQRLLDTVFSAEQLNPMLDRLLGTWLPQRVIDRMKVFADTRRDSVRSQIPLSLSFTGYVASASMLVSNKSNWKFLDDGSNQGTGWRDPVFNDSAWKSGPAELGYGDGDEATVVSYGPSSSAKYITTYFRRSFYATNVASLTGVNLRVMRDDGAVVYLNGTEVYRSPSMPSGTISSTTRATTGQADNFVDTAVLPASVLVEGANVVAVEIHQDSGSSSDISFDLEMIGVASGGVSAGGTVNLAGVGNVLDTRSVQLNGVSAAWTAWNGTWQGTVQVLPGINRVLIQAFDSNQVEIARSYVDVPFNTGREQAVSGPIVGATTWWATNGPYHVAGNVTVGSGATLTIEAGATVYFDPGTGITVSGTGRLLAEGAETRRIRMTLAPERAGDWSLEFNNASQESRMVHVDFEYAGGNGRNILARSARIYLDDCTFAHTTVQYITLENSSFNIRRCVFPDNDGVEFIHGVDLPASGYGILQSNWFGSPLSGLNDVIDFSGGHRPNAILQILENTFTGSPDDILDLDGTDAWIEGNSFTRAHKNNTNAGDTASAISGGADRGAISRLTIVRNLFYDCDHVALCKEGNVFTFINNTAVGMTLGGVNFSEPQRETAPGAGVFMDGNIFWNMPQLFLNETSAVTQITVTRSILPTPWPGSGNLVTDPRLANTSTAGWATLREDFRLRSGSPALGAGPNGLDMGGVVPAGASVSGEPSPVTASPNATLTVGGPGITHYRWKLNEGAYSPEVPVVSVVQLSSLADGTYTVSVLGKNDAGVWQDATRPTLSKSWRVNGGYTRVVLNEVMALNASAVTVNAGHPDWIELHNAGGHTASLGGMGLSDDPDAKFKFVFPAGTQLAPGGYLVLLANNPDGTTNYLHLGFGLSGTGDGLYLSDSAGNLVDSIVFGLQVTDLSLGRLPNGSWTLTAPTLGARNVAARLGEPEELVLNEWLAGSEPPFPADFVELYNSEELPVPLAGLYLTDNYTAWPMRHSIPPFSYLPARGYTVFLADGNATAGADHLNFRLSADQGTLTLLASDLAVIDQIFYGPQTRGISEGRRPDGAANIGPLQSPTPGAPNPAPPPAVTVSNVVVNLIGVTDTFWRYNDTGIDLGTSWRGASYSDDAWPLGVGLFGFETTPAVYPYPFNTPMPAPNQAGGRRTVYYRAHFQWTNSADYTLYATNYLDDGAVFYINGVEVDRLRITGDVSYDTDASSQGSEGQPEVRVLPTASLLSGDNVMAVEVHQAGSASSDAVFGLALTAAKSFTNIVSTGVILNEILARNVSLTNSDGSLADWVELYNPSSQPTDLSGMSLTDDTADPRRWVFPIGATLAPGGFLVVEFDGSRPATNSGAVLNTGFGLNADGGDAVYLFAAPAQGGVLLDGITFGLQAPDYSIGRVPDGLGNWGLGQPTRGSRNIAVTLGATTALRVNEWMADPSSGDDWFELYNPQGQPVALGGLYLTDDLANRTKFKIASLSFIGSAPSGYVEFRADEKPENGAQHVTFKLSAGGESLGLFAADGTQIDALTFSRQQKGVSEGRFPDGSATLRRFPGVPTPGASNLLPLENVVVNEVLAHTDPPLEDAIELYNPTTTAIDLSYWFLTDDPAIPDKYRIPEGTVIPALGYVVFYENQFNPDFSGITPSFALSSANGDDVYLFPADAGGKLLGYRGNVSFSATENGVSVGRFLTSVGVDFTALDRLTFGTAVTAEDPPGQIALFRTGAGASNAYPRVGPVVLNEIHYHPPDLATNDNTRDEFIELHNATASPVPLYDVNFPTNTWRLRDAVDFDFPTNIVLPANGYVLVVGFDPATNATELAEFRARYGMASSVPIYGPFNGRLANDSEEIELKRPDGPVPPTGADPGFVPYVMADRVHYMDAAPWPRLADALGAGQGNSLQKRLALLYGNDPVNWYAGAATPGAPNGTAAMLPPTVTSLTAPHTVPAGSTDTLTAVVSGPTPRTYQWYFNGQPLAGATNTSLTLANLQGEQSGVYSILAVNPGGAVAAFTRLDVQVAPQIVQQPRSRIGAAGSNMVFTVSVRGTPPLAYQWWFNGAVIPGATQASYTVANARTNNMGNYLVVVTNHIGAATSQVATLEIQLPPYLLRQPSNTVVLIGRTAVFSAPAGGTAPLTYQWYFGGAAMPGRTTPTLAIDNAQSVHAGPYYLRIFNSVGFAQSQTATLTVVPAPLVTVAATDPVAAEPGTDTGRFRVSRTGSTSQPMEVNLQVGGTATPGADYQPLASRLTIPAGAAFVDVEVVPVDNEVLEGNESVIVTILPGAPYDPGTPGSATVTIFDEDNKAPLVAITNLTNGIVFTLPALIPIQATATDLDGRVTQVEFYANATNRIGLVTNAPYSITWSNNVTGMFELTAVATDDLGSTGTSTPLGVIINIPPVVTLLAPTNGAIYPSNATIVVSATATDVGGTIAQIDFYAGTNRLASDLAAPFTFTWSNVPDGQYVVTARAKDNHGTVTISPAATLWVNLPGGLLADAFAARGTISGDTNFLTGDTTGFTRELGEPRHLDRNGSHSAWVSWIAPASGRCTVDTIGSDFDTVLAVYRQNSLLAALSVSNLLLVASDDDGGGYPVSRVSFDVTAGVAYQIAVDGYSSADYGPLRFHLSLLRWSPVITLQPASQTASPGEAVTFKVAASGPGPLRYQWWHNGLALAAATATTLQVVDVRPMNEGIYVAVVSNSSGTATSAPTTLVLRAPATIDVPPQSQVARVGDTATFRVTAAGAGPFTYQWQFNGADVAGATGSTLQLPSVQYTQGGPYVVKVGNGGAMASSPAAWLIVQPEVVEARVLAGQVRLTIHATPGLPQSVDTSTNLIHWTEAGTWESTLVESHFTNSITTGRKWEFYRVRTVPVP